MRVLVSAALLLVGAQAFAAMSPREIEKLLAQPLQRLETFRFDASVPLEDRVAPCPPIVLEGLRALDGRSDYQAYDPTPQERALVAETLRSLPLKMRTALSGRLISFYFVENLIGNGLTNWAVDAKGRTHVYVILNPSGFRRSLFETLAARDGSLFREAPGVAMHGGTGHMGIVYTVLHESAHAYDHIVGVTPFVHPAVVEILRGGKGGDASWDVWRRYDEPYSGRTLPLRAKLKFFGQEGGPLARAAEARVLYAGLARSPFASLYGAQNWAEDFADLVTFYHLTQVLRQSYAFELDGGLRVEPMKGPALERARRIYRALGGDALSAGRRRRRP